MIMPVEEMVKYIPSSNNNSKSNNMNVLGAVGGIVGAGINYLGQQSTNKANLDLAKQQNDWNEHMWEKNNAYNAPTAQVQRLLDAGINPLGQNFTSYQSSPVQSADMANQQAPQLDTGSIVQGFQGDRNLDIQEKLADADVKLKEVQGVTEAKKAGLLDEQKAEQIIKNKYADEKYKNEAESYKQRADFDASQAYIARLASTFKGTEYYKMLKDLEASANVKEAQSKMYDEQKKWIGKISQAQIRQMVANAKLMDENRRQLSEMLPFLKDKTVAEVNQFYACMLEVLSRVPINNIDELNKALDARLKSTGLGYLSFRGSVGGSQVELPVGAWLYGGYTMLNGVIHDTREHNQGILDDVKPTSYQNPYMGIPKLYNGPSGY